jgi:hypothetical protein
VFGGGRGESGPGGCALCGAGRDGAGEYVLPSHTSKRLESMSKPNKRKKFVRGIHLVSIDEKSFIDRCTQEKKLDVLDGDDTYHFTYQHLCQLGRRPIAEKWNNQEIIRVACMAYSWMPTTITLKRKKVDSSCDTIRNLISDKNKLTSDNIETAAAFLGGSIIGLSKVLHFLAPDVYPIWDTAIYSFIYNKKTRPAYGTVNRSERYVSYCKDVWKLVRSRKVLRKIQRDMVRPIRNRFGYRITPVRAVEAAMFSRSGIRVAK